MRAPSLCLSVFLTLALSGSAEAAKTSGVAGTLMIGWNQQVYDASDAQAYLRRQGGIGGTGTLLYQWPSGFGLGASASFGSIERVREKATRAPCEGCAFERTTLSYGTRIWDVGAVTRWRFAMGEWNPSVQLGLGFGQMSGTRAFDSTSTGLALHLGLGVDWRFSEELPVALRAELRGTAGAYAGDDYLAGAYWTGLLVGVGF
ncbi:outer membrane beta-barrel protein [Hyalangium minutum]|nr:outer membrane beta-barrel protein [Hyalangium minutum]